tara:strand:+ start:95 stop:451 length:357 start_codon:yes stop_codon:yes gene_type:complete
MNTLNRVVLLRYFYEAALCCINGFTRFVYNIFGVNGNQSTCLNYITKYGQNVTLSLTVDSGTIEISRGEGGFDPVTNLQFGGNSDYFLGQPVTEQNGTISNCMLCFSSNNAASAALID